MYKRRVAFAEVKKYLATASSFPHGQAAAAAEFAVRGNSGCMVRVTERDGKTIVEKAAMDASYNERLRRQIGKQKLGRAANNLEFVRIPSVLGEYQDAGLYRAEMEYVYFHGSVDFFSSASKIDVTDVLSMVLAYIDEQIAGSESSVVPMDVLRAKVQSVIEAVDRVGTRDYFTRSIGKILRGMDARRDLEIPVGKCHGDLTFSNIMIASDARSIALIDFLDSFIESPLIDLAKLRQDTLCCWTLLMGDGRTDAARFRQIMAYMDREICAKYSVFPWFRRNIDLMLGITLLRIMPYAQTEATRQFIVSGIDSLRFDHD